MRHGGQDADSSSVTRLYDSNIASHEMPGLDVDAGGRRPAQTDRPWAGPASGRNHAATL
jgi:hypothetical protein